MFGFARLRSVLVLVLAVLVVVVLFADLFALSAAGEGLLPGTGAVLEPVSPASITRPFSRSGFEVSSRLLDGAGQPIVGVSVDVLQRVVGSARFEVVGSAVTRGDGSFRAAVPAGPSRLVDLAYRAVAGGGYVAQTLVFENVSAGLRLRVTPRRTTPTGEVRFEGRVLGRVPAHGVVVEVLVYYLGMWQPIRTPRTSGDGRFRLAYRFHRARGVFPFRMRVRDGQAGFPYGGGWSSWVEVAA